MLNQIKQQIDRLKAHGASYVDTRWYPVEETNSLLMWNGNLKDTSSSRESGVGVRGALQRGMGVFRFLRYRAILPRCMTKRSTTPASPRSVSRFLCASPKKMPSKQNLKVLCG